MNEVILTCYELAASCLPSVIVATALLRRTRRRPRLRELAGMVFFISYVTAVLHVTGAGTLLDGIRRGMPRFDQCNFIPFVNGTDPTQCLLNVVLFIPFGCFLAAAFSRNASVLDNRRAPVSEKRPANRRKRAAAHLAKAALAGFAFSLAIEASQLLTNRVFDVDDLIMNTLGAGIGCVATLACARIGQSVARRRDAKPGDIGPNTQNAASTDACKGWLRLKRKATLVSTEPRQPGEGAVLTAMTATIFLGRFLLFDEMGAAAMLYGF